MITQRERERESNKNDPKREMNGMIEKYYR